jgi:Membrane-bound metallopeptidase
LSDSVEVADASAVGQQEKIPLFGARKKAAELASRLAEAERALAELGALDVVELEKKKAALAAETEEMTAELEARRAQLEDQIKVLEARVVKTEETEILQEIGIYEYRHPLDESVTYKERLKDLKAQIRSMAKRDGGAIVAATDWEVNGSKAQGRKMVRETSKLLLRAYNAEADNLVRGMKPYKLDASIDRLNKSVLAIAKLGQTMNIHISAPYHELRILELEMTADFINKKAEEKEREREEKARLREEKKAQQEMERERKRLEKEREHYLNALAKLEANGDLEGADRLRSELSNIDRAIDDVDYRAANVRAGYVYVISNVGAFGENIVKIGMTRRLEPMDRVRELGDASVPFKFDVHALFFSDDAVGVERELHEKLESKRVNRVNLRREFFYATPSEVKELLVDIAGEILEFEEEPEAVEFRQSQSSQNFAAKA